LPEESKLIQGVAVEHDENRWWYHPGIPDFDGTEDHTPFMVWTAEDLKTWSMDCDLDDHPYWDLTSNCCGCVGWYPESPGPEWFLLGIFDTEDGPHVQ